MVLACAKGSATTLCEHDDTRVIANKADVNLEYNPRPDAGHAVRDSPTHLSSPTSLGPPSITATLTSLSSVNRLARTAPAVPPPTMT